MNCLIKTTDFPKMCRVCFQSTSDLVSCFTKLVIGDVSCTIVEILNLLIAEHNIDDSGHYPKGICHACKELVKVTINLKTKLEKTSQILKNELHSSGFKNIHDTIEIRNNHKIDDCDDESTITFEQHEEEKELFKILPHNFNQNQANSEDVLTAVILQHQTDTFPKASSKIKTKLLNHSKSTRTSPKKKIIFYSLAKTSYDHICPICMINLPNAIEVKKHALNHKTLKKYLKGNKVPDKIRFFTKPHVTNTIFSKQNILHKCVYCRKKITIDNFWKHTLEHNRKNEFHCKKCPRVFRKRNHLNSHITYSHLEELPYQCNQCNKSFVIKENYDAHLLTHNSPEVLPYKCTKCDQKFTNKKHLYYHSFKHTDYGSFSARYKTNKCKTCLQTFDTANDLQDHHVQFHNRKYKTIDIKISADGFYKCEQCSRSYKNPGTYKHHIRKSHGPKKLCSLCGVTVINLKQHLISHQEKKDPLECHICHRLLASKLTLSRHIRVHTGEKPYKCSFCEKTFKDHYPMKVHERVHKGEKKHICAICGKGFLEKSYMLKHLRRVHGK